VILIDEYDKPVFASLIDSYSYQFNYEKCSRFQKSPNTKIININKKPPREKDGKNKEKSI
jgi:hypothetical protein